MDKMSVKSDSNSNYAAKAAFCYLLCNFILKGLSFITTPFFTRLMSTEDYGILNTYNSYLAIISVIVTLDLYSCIQISKKDFKQDNQAFVSSITFLSSISIITFYFFVKGFILVFGDPFELPRYMIDIIFIYTFFENCFNIRLTFLRTNFKYIEFSICTLVFSVMSVVLGLIFVSNMNSQAYWGRIAGNLIPMFFIGLYAMLCSYSKGKCLIKMQYWKYGLLFSIPLIAHHLAGRILSGFDRIMIERICGASTAAIYSLAYNIGAIIEIMWFSLNSAWSPWFYDHLAINDIKKINKIAKLYVIAFCIIILSAIIVAPEIIMIMGPKDYWEGKWVIPPVAMGLFFHLLYGLYANVEMFYKKTKIVAIGTIIAAVLNVVLNSLFIPMHGYIAAAYTTLIGYIVLFIIHFLCARKIDDRDLFDIRFLRRSIIIMILGCICAMLLYNTIVFRYLTLGIILIYSFIKYKSHIFEFIRCKKKDHKEFKE